MAGEGPHKSDASGLVSAVTEHQQSPSDTARFSDSRTWFGQRGVMPSRSRRAQRVGAVFAAFTSDGTVPAYAIAYLKALNEIADYVIVVYDCELTEQQAIKLMPVCDYILSGRHGEYDFGSYKRGLRFFKDQIPFNEVDEIILCNDSCYGPTISFRELYDDMSLKGNDFWGLTYNSKYIDHIQSYFMCFGASVINDSRFLGYFYGVGKKDTVTEVVKSYEVPLTKFLSDCGFSWSTVVGESNSDYTRYVNMNKNLTVFPTYLLSQGCPLIKRKAITDPIVNFDGVGRTLSNIESVNKTVYQNIVDHLGLVGLASAPKHQVSIIMVLDLWSESVIGSVCSFLEQYRNNGELVLLDKSGNGLFSNSMIGKYQKNIDEGQITIIRLDQSLGLPQARNLGIAVSRYSWIGFADPNGWLRPNYLELISESISQNAMALVHYGPVMGTHSRKVVGLDRNPAVESSGGLELCGLVFNRCLTDRLGGFKYDHERADGEFISRLITDAPAIEIATVLAHVYDGPSER